jgi:hypothetical protein
VCACRQRGRVGDDRSTAKGRRAELNAQDASLWQWKRRVDVHLNVNRRNAGCERDGARCSDNAWCRFASRPKPVIVSAWVAVGVTIGAGKGVSVCVCACVAVRAVVREVKGRRVVVREVKGRIAVWASRGKLSWCRSQPFKVGGMFVVDTDEESVKEEVAVVAVAAAMVVAVAVAVMYARQYVHV